MAVDDLKPRVVPAAAQVVALLVVGGRAEPGRLELPVVELLEDDEALLPVGLVVVGALERRAPVVHRVQEHVVEDDPAALADDPAVVDDARDPRRGSRRSAPTRRRPCRPGPGREQERRDEPGVDEAGQQAHAAEPARRREDSGRPGRFRHRRELDGLERLGDEPQELEPDRAARSPAAARRSRSSVPAGIDHDFASRRVGPLEQVAVLDVRLGGHREEQLAVGEAQ